MPLRLGQEIQTLLRQSDCRLILASLRPGERLQLHYSTSNDFNRPLDRYAAQTDIELPSPPNRWPKGSGSAALPERPDPKIDKAIDDALARAQFQVIPLDQAFKAKWDQAKKDGDTWRQPALGSAIENSSTN